MTLEKIKLPSLEYLIELGYNNNKPVEEVLIMWEMQGRPNAALLSSRITLEPYQAEHAIRFVYKQADKHRHINGYDMDYDVLRNTTILKTKEKYKYV